MRTMIFVLTLLLSGAPIVSGDAATVVARPSKAPKIDGALNDECWKQAVPLALKLASGKPPTEKTIAKVCHDDWNLYVAFECDESAMAKLVARLHPWTA